jgi:hypothetical protein
MALAQESQKRGAPPFSTLSAFTHPPRGTYEEPRDETPTLEDLGLTKKAKAPSKCRTSRGSS